MIKITNYHTQLNKEGTSISFGMAGASPTRWGSLSQTQIHLPSEEITFTSSGKEWKKFMYLEGLVVEDGVSIGSNVLSAVLEGALHDLWGDIPPNILKEVAEYYHLTPSQVTPGALPLLAQKRVLSKI